jgi:hypothetical protein
MRSCSIGVVTVGAPLASSTTGLDTAQSVFHKAVVIRQQRRARFAAQEIRDRHMTKDPPDPALHFGNLISAYTDTIRTSDFKANLAVLFVAIMMGPIVAYRDKYPHFLSLPIVLAPFIIAFFCLLICVYPRYPRRGGSRFLIRNPTKDDFVFRENNDDDIQQLKIRCSILSGILFWKTLFLNISLVICLGTIVVIFLLLSYSLLQRLF